jgi:hypothetical protein
MSTLTAQIQLRRDTSANWTTNNTILLAGEVAFTSDVFYTGTDQQRFKIGDGVQTWLQLDYVPEGGASAYPENLFLTVVNKTTDNLLASEYKVLKVITAQGGRLAVDYALADSDANSADTIGVVYENINNNQEGRIITIGEITGINTTGNLQGETWADGDSLFLSDTIDGGITNVRPTAPNHGVRLGYVVNVNANNGKIYIKIDNGYELSEIHDIYAPTPTHNQGIFWSSGTTRYENKSIATVLGYTPENVSNKSSSFTSSSTTTFANTKALVDGLATKPIILFAQMQSVNPADATIYFFGNIPFTPSNGIAGARLIPIPQNMTLNQIILTIRCVAGSNEATTFSLYKNGSLLGSLPTTVDFSIANQMVMQSNLNYSLVAGDYLEISFVNTWTTNPTGVVIAAQLIGI